MSRCTRPGPHTAAPKPESSGAVNYPYPDREIRWPDGSAGDAELRGMLRECLAPYLDIEHADFAWSPSGSLEMEYRLAAKRGRSKPEHWTLSMSYPAGDAAGVSASADPEQRRWFVMMVKTHIEEWWGSGECPGITARRTK